MPDRRYSRTPDTISVLIACILSGVILAATRTVPPSVDGLVPWWVGMVWSTALALSASASLVGLLHRDVMTGWLLEITGRCVLTGALGAYCLALVVVATSWGSAVPILLTAGVCVASAWRVRQVMRKLAQVREVVRQAETS